MSRSPKQIAWARSPEFHLAGKHALARALAGRHLKPKCGAIRKSTGTPCQSLQMANGRCRFHGGKTPKGDLWHRPTFTNKPEKNARKEAERERRARREAKRVAAMSPEERAKRAAWDASHKPGRASARAERRRNLSAQRTLAQLLGPAATAPQPEPLHQPKVETMVDDVTYMTGDELKPALLERIRTEGALEAYETGLRILRDPKSTSAAKATIVGTFMKMAGFLEKPGAIGEEQILRMSPVELKAFMRWCQDEEAQLEQMIARRKVTEALLIEAVPSDEGGEVDVFA